jgi:hypothetical protein
MAESAAAIAEERAEGTEERDEELVELTPAMAEERVDVAEQIVDLAGEIVKIAESGEEREEMVDEMGALTLESLEIQLLAEVLTSRAISLDSGAWSDRRPRLVRAFNSRNNELSPF